MTLLARRREEIDRDGSRSGHEDPGERRRVAVRRQTPLRSFHLLQAAVGNRATVGLLRSAQVLAKRRGEPKARIQTPANGALESEAARSRFPLPELSAASPEVGSASPEPALRPQRLIVPDGAVAGPGQMNRRRFLVAIEHAARRAADQGLAPTGRSARDCPWIALYLVLYRRLPAERIEEDIRHYVPGARSALTVEDYLEAAQAHIRRSVENWVATGELTGVPRKLPGMGLITAAAGSLAGVKELLRKAKQAGVPRPSEADHGPAAAAGSEAKNGSKGESPPSIQLSEGRPFAGAQRQRMEGAFGRSFDGVRLHTDAEGVGLARRFQARAVTMGSHIAFDRGEYRPGTLVGDALLAHELAHVSQQADAAQRDPLRGTELEAARVAVPFDRERALEQDADRIAADALFRLGGVRSPQRSPLTSGLRLSRCASRTFTLAELHSYLDRLRRTRRIEGGLFSDDKARQIVSLWRTGRSEFVLTTDVVILLVEEMQTGVVSDEDQQAILELVTRLPNSVLNRVFARGAIRAQGLVNDFDGERRTALEAFFNRRFDGGLDAVAEGQRVQAIGTPELSIEAAERRRRRRPESQQTCSVGNPAGCSTYSSWIRQFATLPTFAADDTFTAAQRWTNLDLGGRSRVIGPSAAPERANAGAPAARRRPVPYGGQYGPGDYFIDGPTQQWLDTNLPPHLVLLAYQLPADCADIAYILRHVWLAARRRETILGTNLIVGSRSGDASAARVDRTIRNVIHSRASGRFVNEYRDDRGRVLRSFPALEPLLQPGDILIWGHSSGGGHAETIMAVDRRGGRITSIRTVMGNQPINEQEAIQLYGRQGRRLRSVPRGDPLRSAPGRRLEVHTLAGDRLRDRVEGIWGVSHGRNSSTDLIAAGPPGPSTRPRPQRRQPRVLTDWVRGLGAQRNHQTLTLSLEQALLEARSRIATARDQQSIRTLTEQAQRVATAAGTRLWELASAAAGDLSNAGTAPVHETHTHALTAIRRMIAGFGRESRHLRVQRLFEAMEQSFVVAARGGASINFNRRGRPSRVLRVLVVGFDPFNATNSTVAPQPGDFNPSGQAALAMDNEQFRLGRAQVAIESIVLPVSYEDFDGGIVERMLGPHIAQLDALITVGQRPRSAAEDDALHLERYAVGVRRMSEDSRSKRRRAIPPAPGTAERGAGIIETRAPLAQAAAAVGQAGLGTASVNEGITLRFHSQESAQNALRALGVAQQAGGAEVRISDRTAIEQIMTTMERGVLAESPGILFSAGGQRFQAIIVRGPAGAFLCNELSFRALRMISARSGRRPASFHVHTPAVREGPDEAIPQGDADARRTALATSLRLVRRLQIVIRAVAQERLRASGRQPTRRAGTEEGG